MRLVTIGVAAISLKVGDFTGNLERLRASIHGAKAEGVHLLVTPELSISGYSLEDRIWWPDIARRSGKALWRLAADCRGISVFVGLPVVIDGLMYNAAAFIHDGEVRGMVLKKFLPTYGIFYEGRNWTPWPGGTTTVLDVPAGDLNFKVPYGVVSAEICEDMWSVHQPARERVLAGAEVICNLSASPFTPRKNEQRKRLVLHTSQRLACVYAYANILGLDNSRLVFDGGGLIATPDGIVADAPLLSIAPSTLATAVVDLDEMARFRSENTTWREYVARREDHGDIVTVDAAHGGWSPASVGAYASQLPRHFYVPDPVPAVSEPEHALDELFAALVLGLRDYYEKSGVFDRFLIALSGGRDSALCLLLAVHAAKAFKGGTEPEAFAAHIDTVYLPNRAYSTVGTETAAGTGRRVGRAFSRGSH
jgi:NAD+ synthase (glutamine-hydrolysing)